MSQGRREQGKVRHHLKLSCGESSTHRAGDGGVNWGNADVRPLNPISKSNRGTFTTEHNSYWEVSSGSRVEVTWSEACSPGGAWIQASGCKAWGQVPKAPGSTEDSVWLSSRYSRQSQSPWIGASFS